MQRFFWMKFEEEDKVVYCKDESYNKVCNNNKFNYSYNGDILYYRGCLVDREDGPAIEYKEDYLVYQKNEYTVEYNYEQRGWYKDGKKHREDGPAEAWSDGIKEWWLNDREYSEKEYWKMMNLKNKNRVLDEI